jgi:hypothetical protein
MFRCLLLLLLLLAVVTGQGGGHRHRCRSHDFNPPFCFVFLFFQLYQKIFWASSSDNLLKKIQNLNQ